MARDNIFMSVDVLIKNDPENRNKPYLELKFPAGAQNQMVIYVSSNLGEMIGGVANGAYLRWHDQHPGEQW